MLCFSSLLSTNSVGGPGWGKGNDGGGRGGGEEAAGLSNGTRITKK